MSDSASDTLNENNNRMSTRSSRSRRIQAISNSNTRSSSKRSSSKNTTEFQNKQSEAKRKQLSNKIAKQQNKNLIDQRNNASFVLTQSVTSIARTSHSPTAIIQPIMTPPVNDPNTEDASSDLFDSTGLEASEVVEKMYQMGKNGKFPQKKFVVNQKVKLYTAYLHFTSSQTIVNDIEDKINFKCMFCENSNFHAKLGFTSNIKKHLEKFHRELDKWFTMYNDQSKYQQHMLIDKKILKLVIYFISSNAAASEFDKIEFRNILNYDIPCSKTFSDFILVKVMNKLKEALNTKLENAASVCLISDIWTNKSMLDFMGLAVNIIDSSFNKKTLVIGMMLMPGNHCAEYIKEAIEALVNNYDFNKSKIHGKYYSDSNLLKKS